MLANLAAHAPCRLLGQLLLLVLIIGIGCSSKPPSNPDGPGALTPAAVNVDVARVTTRMVTDYREYTGRTAAVSSVEVRARVSGYLLQSPQAELATDPPQQTVSSSESSSTSSSDVDPAIVTVKEGDLVQAGTLLFQIDPKPYQLSLEQTEGSLEAARANLKLANQNLSRSRELVRQSAVSQAEYDQAVATVTAVQGQIDTLTATRSRNLLDLKYTRVRSPINGLLGRTLLTNGNLVSADTTVLTTVVAVDPIYVNFDVDEQSVLDYRKRMLQGEVRDARETTIELRLGLANEEGFPHAGVIDFVDNTTNPNSGNTSVRGVFENPTGILSPGLFARIQAPFTAAYEAVVVPTVAIGTDQQGQYVMVIDDTHHVQRRAILAGGIDEDMTVIRQGLAKGELVVTAGLQKIRSGVEVNFKADTVQLSGTADSAAPAATEVRAAP